MISWCRLLAAVLAVSAAITARAATDDENTLPIAEDGYCTRLEAGTGDHSEQPHAVPYAAQAARSLRVDLDRDVAMIAFPGNIGFDPNYALALKRNSRNGWSLTYAVDAGISGTSKAFRATVSMPEALAQRVANAWKAAIADASRDAGGSECIGFDGKSYAFSADGRQAHIWEPKGGAAEGMIEISETLKSIVLDMKLTGRATRASQIRLARQLDRFEHEQNPASTTRLGSNSP